MKTLLTTILLCTAVVTTAGASDKWRTYKVTITNATNKQVITPPLLITHNRHFRLFEVTGVASDGLVVLAETGNPAPLHAEVAGASGVFDTIAASAPVVYGTSASFEISAPKRAMLTFSGMLATTNDAFAAVNAVPLPKKRARYFAYTYDAGSEINNESCAYIPGPPCPADSGNLRTETGEGFITIHNGIHGGSDLNPKQLDWRGPTAIVTVERVDD